MSESFSHIPLPPPRPGIVRVAAAKLHGLRVTDANLNYHGSVTLDPDHCALAGILPMEFVEIWNKTSGARISTYVILGTPGSRCCVLNGAAARTCQPGDEVIICASTYCDASLVLELRPRVLTFFPDNSVAEVLEYDTSVGEDRRFRFQIRRLAGTDPRAAR